MLYERCNEQDTNDFTSGRGGNEVLVNILHDTCGPDDHNDPKQDPAIATKIGFATANYLLQNSRQVSAHWYIGPEASGSGPMADIHHLVHEYDTAYHAGGNPSEGFPSGWTDPDTGIHYGGFALNLVSAGVERHGQADDIVGPRQLAAIAYLFTEHAGPDGTQPHGIFGRHPKTRNVARNEPHKFVEPGDRWDGVCYVGYVRSLINVFS